MLKSFSIVAAALVIVAPVSAGRRGGCSSGGCSSGSCSSQRVIMVPVQQVSAQPVQTVATETALPRAQVQTVQQVQAAPLAAPLQTVAVSPYRGASVALSGCSSGSCRSGGCSSGSCGGGRRGRRR